MPARSTYNALGKPRAPAHLWNISNALSRFSRRKNLASIRLVASSIITIKTARSPRPSNQSCSLPSIWINSPKQRRRCRRNRCLPRRRRGCHNPASFRNLPSVSLLSSCPSPASFSHASVGPKSPYFSRYSDHFRPQLVRQTIVGMPPPRSMHQTVVTFCPVPFADPTHLTQRNARQFRRFHRRQLSSPDPAYQFQMKSFLARHLQCSHPTGLHAGV